MASASDEYQTTVKGFTTIEASVAPCGKVCSASPVGVATSNISMVIEAVVKQPEPGVKV